ncbi:glycoside hydrolase family 99-like domain-containing protein [Eubacterium limosum]|uniref:glycosyltransferase WbsX family protein n=1 Tax=Eubacterium limosum TaxID=1736 RepID=UPI00106415F7|nr:glycoside hydrolase family 99-like domain-containing protein [Eubacterium limosum]
MKCIAFYLPQFHAIPENDKWWGKGFTEWDNIRSSKPQFKGHVQPEIPLNNNYYNLLDSKVQENQAKLAQKYGVYGFCYYHYWFDGKLLLEKPMENMLNNQNIDIPFCICWANETWSRTWDGQENKILIKQNYNEKIEEWKKHFNYLLPFFKDKRYIKINNCPIMIIYKPQFILKCSEMIKYWNDMAVKHGFSGIYWGYQHFSAYDSDVVKSVFNFGIEFEPFYTVWELKKDQNFLRLVDKLFYGLKHPEWLRWKLRRKIFRVPQIYNYDEIWKRIIKRKPKYDNIMPGAFTAWDNTPRKGNNSCVFWGANPQKFGKYFKLQIEHCKTVYHSEYLFINAWNEWAEGAHLEPDELNGYEYLKSFEQGLRNYYISSQ